MNIIKVSIIIPTYNVQDYIEECIESCYAQTYNNIEVICIDNNSTDSTFHKLQNLNIKYPQLVIDKETKAGAPSARNKGLSLAKGEWIQFLDADDLLLTNKIEHQIKLINKINCDLIYANYSKRKVNGEESTTNLNDKDLWLNLFNTSLGITSSNLWKKKNLLEVGVWDESLSSSQEYNLLFRYLKNTDNVFFDKEHLTIIRERENGQISQTDIKGKWERYLNLRLEILNYLEENKKGYFYKNKSTFDNLLFDILRTIYPQNKQLAINTYKKLFSNKYIPQVSNVTTSNYISFFKLFGFGFTEKLKSILKK